MNLFKITVNDLITFNMIFSHLSILYIFALRLTLKTLFLGCCHLYLSINSYGRFYKVAKKWAVWRHKKERWEEKLERKPLKKRWIYWRHTAYFVRHFVESPNIFIAAIFFINIVVLVTKVFAHFNPFYQRWQHPW